MYSSLSHLGLEPNTPYAPFYMGRAIHAALESHYANGTPVTEALDAFMEITLAEMETSGSSIDSAELSNNMELMQGIATHYELWSQKYKGDFADGTLKFVSLETSFSIPISDQLTFSGRYDGVVRHLPTGDLYLWETKTTSSMDSFSSWLDRSEQATGYVWAAQEAGLDVKGVLYNIIRKKEAPWPEVLKSTGMLSVNKSIDTPAYVYMAAIEEHHADMRSTLSDKEWRDFVKQAYGGVLSALMAKDSKYVDRIAVVKTPEELRTWYTEYVQVAKEMIDPNTPLYRSEGQFNCQFCPFKGPCDANKKGDLGEEERLKLTMYRPRVLEVHTTGE